MGMDLGIRCAGHVGEVFRVRCAECDALAVEGPAVATTDAEQWAPTTPDERRARW